MDEKKIDDDVLFTFSSRNVRMEIKSHLLELADLNITGFFNCLSLHFLLYSFYTQYEFIYYVYLLIDF